MHPLRRNNLISIVCFMIVLAAAVALVLYALRQNIILFYSPTEVATGQAPLLRAIRVGGLVVPGSIVRGEKLNVSFKLTDNAHTLLIQYNGILPDLFREGQGIVAEGQWMGGSQVNASTVLAKHDENYMPPEVKDALGKADNQQKKVRS